MKQHTENPDQLGPYYKMRFEEFNESPEKEVKADLFSKMDMLEGKRPKTVYLHFNLFGMKIAASITMLIVSSLALVAVAAVTVIAIKNNTSNKSEQQLVPSKNENSPAKEPSSIQKSVKKPALKTGEESPANTEDQNVSDQPLIPEPKPESSSKPDNEDQTKVQSPPLTKKETDNRKLLKELDEEDSLFGK